MDQGTLTEFEIIETRREEVKDKIPQLPMLERDLQMVKLMLAHDLLWKCTQGSN